MCAVPLVQPATCKAPKSSLITPCSLFYEVDDSIANGLDDHDIVRKGACSILVSRALEELLPDPRPLPISISGWLTGPEIIGAARMCGTRGFMTKMEMTQVLLRLLDTVCGEGVLFSEGIEIPC